MRFSLFVLIASSLAASLAAPMANAATVTSLSSRASNVIDNLVDMNAIGSKMAANASARPVAAAINHMDSITALLVRDQAGGLLGGLLGGGGSSGALSEILGGDDVPLSGLLGKDLLGGLLDGGDGGLLGGLLNGDLLSSLLGGLLGPDGPLGGLLGGLLGGGGGGGLLGPVSGLLGLFPELDDPCGTDLLGELLDVVQNLVCSLTGALSDGQECDCGRDATLRANVAALIETHKNQLAPIQTH